MGLHWLLTFFDLAKIKKIAPRVRTDLAKDHIDHETLHAIVTNRYDVLAAYARAVSAVCLQESARLQSKVPIDKKTIRRWLRYHEHQLSAAERGRISAIVSESSILRTVETMRSELMGIWRRSSLTKDQLVRQVEDWCHQAEESGVLALREFAQRLRTIG